MTPDDILTYNRHAWDRQVERGNGWTRPVGPEEVARARRGDWTIVLTPTKPVPATGSRRWPGLDVLCLASGGGQQGPILAAAGAKVTVFDNSPRQLAQDRLVADREGLDDRDGPGRHGRPVGLPRRPVRPDRPPVSNVFVPDVRPVWREAFRVLRPGGSLLSGFMNPVRLPVRLRRPGAGRAAGGPPHPLLRPGQPDRGGAGRARRGGPAAGVRPHARATRSAARSPPGSSWRASTRTSTPVRPSRTGSPRTSPRGPSSRGHDARSKGSRR